MKKLTTSNEQHLAQHSLDAVAKTFTKQLLKKRLHKDKHSPKKVAHPMIDRSPVSQGSGTSDYWPEKDMSLNEQELEALKSPTKTHMMPEYSEPKNYYELYWELYL